MRDNDGVFPLKYHDVNDDTGSDPDDATNDPAASTAGDRFVALS